MALRGTLKDFGIADILQLIGHQSKSGVLTVRSRSEMVKLYFRDGSVVRTEASGRKERDRIGSLLVRAEVITDVELRMALESQARTGERLGDILIAQTSLTRETLRSFTRLQSTETIYRLFLWESGTYELESGDVNADEDMDPIRSETILMEGFRQVDEWPALRKALSGYNTRFMRIEDLDELLAQAKSAASDQAEDDFSFGDFDDFGGGGGSKDPRLRNIGDNERFIYQLVTDDRDVQKLIDLSRLGEFEACKALVNLLEAGIMAPNTAVTLRAPSAEATVGGITQAGRTPWRQTATRAILFLVLLAAALFGAWRLGVELQQTLSPLRGTGYEEMGLQKLLGRGQLARIDHALHIYRAERGRYPESLDALVEAGLLDKRHLRFPWQRGYHYRVEGDGYRLVRPIY